MVRKRFVNPFFPNRPVSDPEYFSGRKTQVDSIIDSLFQTINGNPTHTIITGDRGIGKSSLLVQTKVLATGNDRLSELLDIDLGIENYDFIVAWHDADFEQTPQNVSVGLVKDLQSNATKFLSKINIELDIAGFVNVSQRETNDKSVSELVNEFCKRIEKAAKEVEKKEKSGILLFIDEIDRMDPRSGMATFLKLATEKLNRDGVSNVAFVCAGITGAVQQMEEDHASIFRTLKDVPIPRLNYIDSKEILVKGFCKVGVTYDNEILHSVYRLSAGFPEPVHLLGSELLAVDEDGHLSLDDCEKAKINVIENVRKNQLQSLLKQAGSGNYQIILEAMAEHENTNVPLEVISRHIDLEQNQYSTNISNLVKRNIIHKVDRGVYTFVDPLLKEYIKNFGIVHVHDQEED